MNITEEQLNAIVSKIKSQDEEIKELREKVEKICHSFAHPIKEDMRKLDEETIRIYKKIEERKKRREERKKRMESLKNKK